LERSVPNENQTQARLEARIRELEAKLANLDDSPGHDQYREFFERSADAILIIDDDTFVDCNQATVDLLRYGSKDELLQTHPSELSPEYQPDGRPSFEKANEMIALAFDNGSHRFEWEHVRSDGIAFPVEVLLTPITRNGRSLVHVAWRDISERKRLEDELRQAQKMEAIGKLTGGIAHDFNNLLVAILGYADLLDMELSGQDELQEFVGQIRLAGDRAATLVRKLLAYSRKQVLEPEVFDLNQTLAELTRMLVPMLGEDIVFTTDLCVEPLFIKADPGQLEQVVVNLASNARDAMPGEGTLTLATRRIQRTDATGNQTTFAAVRMTDSGEGISAEDIEKIFDPFFTTKGLDQGTGLGLSTVHGIIKQSGGDISVCSVPGEETVFEIYLPLTQERPSDRQPGRTRSPRASLTAAETILLVEDEPAVSELIQTVLRQEGFKVHAAGNGREALELVESLDLKPDLLLTDVIMPEMGGPELAKQLEAKMPSLKVLFSSGYTDSALISRGALEEGVELIQKPFIPAVMVDRLRNMLATS